MEHLDQWREPMLHSQLYSHARLVSFKEEHAVFHLLETAQPDLLEKLTRLLKEKTGKPWKIQATSTEDGQPTLAQVAANQEAQLKKEVSEGPLVKCVLESFPGSKIEKIDER
jgi:DNA polymerase-3 subunit gamma/tau